MASAAEKPYWAIKASRERIPKTRWYSRWMSSAFFREMPCTCARASGSFSMTSRVRLPKRSTMRRAVTGPMPLMAPEARYLRMAPAVAGSLVVQRLALNWRPKVGWLTKTPVSSTSSPSLSSENSPTAVISSPSQEMSTTDQPFSRLRKTTPSTVPASWMSCSARSTLSPSPFKKGRLLAADTSCIPCTSIPQLPSQCKPSWRGSNVSQTSGKSSLP